MQSLEERVAYLEGRMEDHSAGAGELRTDVRELRADTNRQFTELRGDMNQQFTEVRAEMTGQFTEVRTEMSQQFTDVRSDMSRQFRWLVGIQLAFLVSVVGAVLGAYFR